MTIHLEHEAMRAARADLAHAHQLLGQHRATADRRVRGVLGTGWTGAAGEAFGEAWEDWTLAARQVETALEAMGLLLASVHRDLTDRDQDAHQALDRLAGRLGP